MRRKLKQTMQCRNCPWRVDCNLSAIPGYDRGQHINLQNLIAVSGSSSGLGEPITWMACHNSCDTQSDKLECIGWLHNQLGVGNNLPLRLAISRYENAKEIETIGEQKATFTDTL